jgi:hypothetical protein
MKKILLSGIVLLIGYSAMAQNSALLKMNLEKNKVYRLKSASEQTVTQTVNGNQQTVDSQVDYTVSLKMIDVTSDFMIVEVHFDTLSTNTNTMGKSVKFTSTSEGNIKSSEMGDIMSCIMNRLSRNAVFVKMDFTGKPLNVVNTKMLSDLILKDTSSITLTGPTAAAFKAQAASLVSEDNLKNMISTFTWSLPGKQVSAGETWIITQQINSGGMLLDITTSHHLDLLTGSNANVSVESDIRAPENAAPIKSGGATVIYDDLRGSGKSKMVIDTLTGLAVENKSETHISGNLGISGPGFSMQMPMDIISKSSVRALK